MQDKALSLIGLATKAGKIVSGSFSVEKAVKRKEVFLVIVAEDASENTKKHFNDMCKYRNIPISFYGMSGEIGKYTGKDSRTVIAVTDRGFGEKLRAVITEVQI